MFKNLHEVFWKILFHYYKNLKVGFCNNETTFEISSDFWTKLFGNLLILVFTAFYAKIYSIVEFFFWSSNVLILFFTSNIYIIKCVCIENFKHTHVCLCVLTVLRRKYRIFPTWKKTPINYFTTLLKLYYSILLRTFTLFYCYKLHCSFQELIILNNWILKETLLINWRPYVWEQTQNSVTQS